MSDKTAIQAEIEDCLAKVRAALVVWGDNPQHACSDCGTAAPLVPVRIELKYDPVKGYTAAAHSYEITNWSFHKTEGWLAVDKSECMGADRRTFCPECRKKRDL